jgi:hypothetical protein
LSICRSNKPSWNPLVHLLNRPEVHRHNRAVRYPLSARERHIHQQPVQQYVTEPGQLTIGFQLAIVAGIVAARLGLPELLHHRPGGARA